LTYHVLICSSVGDV